MGGVLSVDSRINELNEKIESINSLIDKQEKTRDIIKLEEKSEIEQLRLDNSELKKQLKLKSNLIEKLMKNREEKKVNNIISPVAVEKFVDKLLADPDTNMGFIPDIAEKAMYVKLITMFLSSFKTTLGELDVNFIGHKIKISFDPK